MIQRIQTVYLLAALVLASLVFFVPVSKFINENGSVFYLTYNGLWELTTNGLQFIKGSFAISAGAIVAILSVFTAIMSYKNRLQQIRYSWVSIIVFFAFGITMLITQQMTASKNALESASFPWILLTPAVAMLFNFLAIKAIRRDEDLVRSADRLR